MTDAICPRSHVTIPAMKLLNPYGLLNGNVVHVDEVEGGLSCGCLCPQCNKPLMARQGDIREHHFAHASGQECHEAYETAIHLMCKEILSRAKTFRLPDPDPFSTKPVYMNIDTVEVEKTIEDIRPDIIAYDNGVPLIIEIYVWHRTDREKTARIQSLGYKAVEVTLKEFLDSSNKRPDINLEERLIHAADNRRWLINEPPPEIKIYEPKPTEQIERRTYTSYMLPQNVCRECRRDVAIVDWIQHSTTDGTYLCAECNRRTIRST